MSPLMEQGRVWDHPRACGEYWCVRDDGMLLGGSPPRMRGILKQAHGIIEGFRITPAHAGNTLQKLLKSHQCQDHPRACGEYLAVVVILQRVIGSPPRMRGIRKDGQSYYFRSGITPAHAGNTRLPHGINRNSGDHPRACGEYIEYGGLYGLKSGSPPRMRGILARQYLKKGRLRITPAHAGNTVSGSK